MKVCQRQDVRQRGSAARRGRAERILDTAAERSGGRIMAMLAVTGRFRDYGGEERVGCQRGRSQVRRGPATLVCVEGSRSIVYAFGVGLANFAAGRSRLPRQIAADVADVLPLVAWYGATGNLALATGEPADVAQRLAEITGTAWAVMPAQDLAAALDALAAQPTPRVPPGIRATPGLAFAVEPARPGLIGSIPEAALQRFNDRIVLIHKFDVLAGNRLDRARRRGGWGRLSAALARQAGGRWTARSRRPLAALQARAEHL
jgi:hypothetical protein